MVVLVVNGYICRSTCGGNRHHSCVVACIVVCRILEYKLLHDDIGRKAQRIAVAVQFEVLVVTVKTGGRERVDAVGPCIVLTCALIVLYINGLLIACRCIYMYIIQYEGVVALYISATDSTVNGVGVCRTADDRG